MITGLEVLPYRLGLVQPWASTRSRFAEREGWLVRIEEDGQSGFGDCAPLPEAGTETPAQAQAWLARWPGLAVGQAPAALLEELDADAAPVRSARYAIECALLDLLSQTAGVTLRAWLAPFTEDWIPVNAALGRLCEDSDQAAHRARQAGFTVLKLKVGLAEPDAELARLRELVKGLPDGTRLRLDANGAWDMPTAVHIIEELGGLPIEALEEPLRRPRARDLHELQELARFPLALDESLHSTDANQELHADPSGDLADVPVQRLVLKPAALGGLRTTLEFGLRAIAVGHEVVITSLIESAAGIWPAAQLAAALPGQPAHGLATSSWLRKDLGPPPLRQAGWIRLPTNPGSGFRAQAPAA